MDASFICIFNMKVKSIVTTVIHCSLERAFKTPILGDATIILAGNHFIPPVTHFTDDSTWGKVGGFRIPHSGKSIFNMGGEVGLDTILERIENKYWKWELGDFRQWSLGFSKFQGELSFTDIKDGSIHVEWVYSLYSKHVLLYPFYWLFAVIVWKNHMKKALSIIKMLAEAEAPYVY